MIPFMDSLFSHLPNVHTYIDDIVIASETEEEHLTNLQEVLSILSTNNLRITPTKCEFFKESLTFLGYHISADGIKPPSDRISTISNFPLPTTSTDLRRFLGMLQFFRHMIPNFANIAFPISELLRYNPTSKSLPWTETARASFQELKQALADSPTLHFPSPKSSHFHLVTDSSNHAAGAALYQLLDGTPHPIAFFSKKYSETQRTYSTYDRELLAAFLAVLHFKTLIDGHTVTLFTDHKPLVAAFYSKNIPKSDRQQRQLSLISEYVSDLQFLCGRDNIVADCLSRPISAISTDIFDLPGLARAQQNDPELQTYKDRLTSFPLPNNLELWCDISLPTPRPFVPESLRTSIISFLHQLSHPGIKTTSKLVKARYFWPSMDPSIKEFVHTCLPCQSSKVTRHTRSPIRPISAPSDRFQTVHIDIVGPLPPASTSPHADSHYRYLLTCIDRATRWTEAIPLVDTTATSVAIAFLSGWISRFGVPLTCVTDRGSQFESELFSQLSTLIGFHHIRTTSYHPQSNGYIERFHRTLKAAIMARRENWLLSLPIILLGIRMSPNSLDYSPFTAVTGAYILCPHPIITKDNPITTSNDTLQHFLTEMQSINFYDFSTGDCHSVPPSYVPSALSDASKVWLRVDRVRRSLEAPYTGPYDVLERRPKHFVLKLPQGNTSVSIDRLKPAFLPSPPPLSRPITQPSPLSPQTSQPITQPSQPTTQLSSPVIPHPNPPSPPQITRSGRRVKFKASPEFRYF